MFNKEELEELLTNMGKKIDKPVNVYMIGGCALSFKGLKPLTKDIDIITTNRQDFDEIDGAMKKNGFELDSNLESEFYLTALAVYKKEDSRIDIFLKQVGKMLLLSENMTKRSEKYKDYGKLAIYLVSNEDIFLFKSMTSREGDVVDCDRIMKQGIDYKIIYKEMIEQSKSGKKWFFWAYESLCRIENYNQITIPIKSKVFALVKKHWKEKPSDFMGGIENMGQHIPDRRLLNEIKKV